MAYSIGDFTTELDTYLKAINDGTLPGRTSLDVFAATSEATYNPACWANHLPLDQVVWGNTAGFGGRGVAITPRHVICSEHGRIPDEPHHSLIWYQKPPVVGQPAIRVDRQIAGAVRSIFDTGIYGGQSNSIVGFMLVYVTSDIPPALVGHMPHYNDLPAQVWQVASDAGRFPVLAVRRNQLTATIWEAVDIRHHQANAFPNWFNNYATFRRPDFPALPTPGQIHRLPFFQEWTTGDSGGAAFLVNNDRLVYWGQITGAVDGVLHPYAEGPTYAGCYDQIVRACDILSERHAGPGVPWYKPGMVFGSKRPPNYFEPGGSGPLGP